MVKRRLKPNDGHMQPVQSRMVGVSRQECQRLQDEHQHGSFMEPFGLWKVVEGRIMKSKKGTLQDAEHVPMELKAMFEEDADSSVAKQKWKSQHYLQKKSCFL